MIARYRKKGDLIAEQIKQWIVDHELAPGDRLPTESVLAETFEVGKSSVREALKSLEVQGLVTTSTGPGGGPIVAEVSRERMLGLLQNYFFFQRLSAEQIYELRRALEPQLAAHVAEVADKPTIEALEGTVDACRSEAKTPRDWRVQMQHHIRFHEILANSAGKSNPLLCMYCLSINNMTANVVEMRVNSAHRDLIRSNLRWHELILKHIKRNDPPAAKQAMFDHIRDIESYFPSVKPVVRQRFMQEIAPSEKVELPQWE